MAACTMQKPSKIAHSLQSSLASTPGLGFSGGCWRPAKLHMHLCLARVCRAVMQMKLASLALATWEMGPEACLRTVWCFPG